VKNIAIAWLPNRCTELLFVATDEFPPTLVGKPIT
jgi:hypothetical protein